MKNLYERIRLFLTFIINEFWLLSVNCLQFGDTGKGKFVDLLARLANIIVRCTGGDNAGHTVICKGQEKVFHLIPSGIIHDVDGKINIIATGAVIYPKTLIDEVKTLQASGIPCKNLRISLKAKLIMPYHIVLDRISEAKAGSSKIGTTGKGIGPTYEYHVARRGLIMNDLLNPEVFKRKLKKAVEHAKKVLASYDPSLVKEIMVHEHLEFGAYYQEQNLFDLDAIAEKYLAYGDFLSPYILDTDKFLQESVGKKRILLEGAQGYLLSVDNGTYPYVTSSDCSHTGLLKGAGLENYQVDAAFGIIKGFYMTRVGGGPFPTEMGGEESDKWCNGGVATRQLELEKYPNADINDEDPMNQGVALRRVANEYGATTGRPRRTGWLDLPLLRYSLRSGANEIIMTKLDVLTGIEKIKICYAYEYQPATLYPVYQFGNKLLSSGVILYEAIIDPEVLQYCKPLYREFPGWTEDISKVRDVKSLPQNLIDILKYIFWENNLNCNLRIISVGPAPDDTIFVGDDEI